MKKQNVLILFLSLALFVVVCIGFLFVFEDNKNSPIYISISNNDVVNRVDSWENSDGDFLLFLPSYARLSDVKFHLETQNEVCINEINITDGMSCESFKTGKEYEIEYYTFGKRINKKITFVKSQNVSTMFIKTESGNMDYIHQNKNNKESGSMVLYDDIGDISYIGDLSTIKGRGNYTWINNTKKPYSIVLPCDADLLKMGSAQEWILLANADDSSNLRNKIIYDFSEEIGLNYSPDSTWVDLYLNGEYAGLYLLSERNEIHSERVNIPSAEGFLVSIEIEEVLEKQNRIMIKTDNGMALRVHYNTDITDEKISKIKSIWQSAENSVVSENGIDDISQKSWKEYIDIDSWAKKYLIEEVFGNSDGGSISQYFYYDGTKIFAGPVWDYDRTLGNRVAKQIHSSETFFTNRLEVNENYSAPLFHYLYKKEDFYSEIVKLFKNEFLPGVSDLCENKIYEYANKIETASQMNDLRWHGKIYVFNDEINYITDYLNKRMDFLCDLYINNKEFCTVKTDFGSGINYAYYAVGIGEKLKDLPEMNDGKDYLFKGWYYKETNEPFDINKPITEDIEIYAKWEESQQNRFGDVMKLLPIAVIAVLFVGLVIFEFKRSRNGGGGVWQKKIK